MSAVNGKKPQMIKKLNASKLQFQASTMQKDIKELKTENIRIIFEFFFELLLLSLSLLLSHRYLNYLG